MSQLFEPILSLSQFKLPPQDIELLSFCESNKLPRVVHWIENLRLTQMQSTCIALYDAIPELCHLRTDVKTRYDMLEAFWPVTQQSLLGLLRDFLQQPLILPEPAQKTALLAQALQKHLLDGYTLCVKELIQQKKLKTAQQELLLNALYRALSALSLLMLRAYQLYTAIPVSMWQRAHCLYQIAEYYDLLKRPTPVAVGSAALTINELYIRLLTLSSIRPNQLSQHDIAAAFRALESWSKHVKLLPSATDEETNLFLVDLDLDSGPIPKNRFASDPDHRVLELDYHSLVNQLSKLTSSRGGLDVEWLGDAPTLTVSTDMPNSLIHHMLHCWSNPAQRHQERKRLDAEVDACVGLIDCHYHISGNLEFDQFINPRNPIQPDSFLSGGFDALVASMSAKKDVETPRPTRQTVFRVQLQNASLGGYCLFWQGDLPTSRVEAGELIGLREPDRRVWSIGVVRWIRQMKNGSQLGIQLLTNQPVPYGAASVFDLGGQSDYMRAIHIPSSFIPDLSPSILTASIPFQENTRVKLRQDDSTLDVRFKKCVYSSSKVRLFQFEKLSSE